MLRNMLRNMLKKIGKVIVGKSQRPAFDKTRGVEEPPNNYMSQQRYPGL